MENRMQTLSSAEFALRLGVWPHTDAFAVPAAGPRTDTAMPPVQLPFYSPTSVLVGTAILVAILLAVVIAVLVGRTRPRRRRRGKRH
jgi:hypothetical protein